MTKETLKFIPLAEAAKNTPYSQEYLSLLARRGKIFARKRGRNWYTTREAIKEYLAEQGLTFVIPKDAIKTSYRGRFDRPIVISADERPEIVEVKEELKPEAFPEEVPERVKITVADLKPLERKFDELRDVLKERVESDIPPTELAGLEITPEEKTGLTRKEREFVQDFSESKVYKFWDFNRRATELLKSPGKALTVIISVVVVFFVNIVVLPFRSVDNLTIQDRRIIINTETL